VPLIINIACKKPGRTLVIFTTNPVIRFSGTKNVVKRVPKRMIMASSGVKNVGKNGLGSIDIITCQKQNVLNQITPQSPRDGLLRPKTTPSCSFSNH
jgi:hypothetical protein